jgi:pSer/pThr/pTyr-binding forkhead associated (FHA) protein
MTQTSFGLQHHDLVRDPEPVAATTRIPGSVPAQPTTEETVRARRELVVQRGPDTGMAYPIVQSTTTIGRHRGCDIVLDDATVSRYHAAISVDHDGYVITDAGSLNGTYINRRPVDQARLEDGDELWIGKFRFFFRVAEPLDSSW